MGRQEIAPRLCYTRVNFAFKTCAKRACMMNSTTTPPSPLPLVAAARAPVYQPLVNTWSKQRTAYGTLANAWRNRDEADRFFGQHSMQSNYHARLQQTHAAELDDKNAQHKQSIGAVQAEIRALRGDLCIASQHRREASKANAEPRGAPNLLRTHGRFAAFFRRPGAHRAADAIFCQRLRTP